MISKTLSVHELNQYVKDVLNRDPILQDVKVCGEISNFKWHSSGHMYFTLKDEHDRLRCVWFLYDNQRAKFSPKDGMMVTVKGMVSLYCKEGQYQFYAKSMEKAGVGDLHIAFERLKEKLSEEGLFKQEIKKSIPSFPKKIAVITSHTGAAVRDIINVIKRRCPIVDLLILPVQVQGTGSVEQITAALNYVSTRQDVDLVILGRGGGSIEELWTFNEEKVARAIWKCNIPVISAVGHETDFTISDFAADLRAPTPSAAGELSVPDIRHLREQICKLDKEINDKFKMILASRKQNLEFVNNSLVFRKPDIIIKNYQQDLDQITTGLIDNMKSIINSKREFFKETVASLNALSPLAVMNRGYSVVNLENNNSIVSSIHSIKPGDRVIVRFKDGKARCKVVESNSNIEGELLNNEQSY